MSDGALAAEWGPFELAAEFDSGLELASSWGPFELAADLYVTEMDLPALGIALKQGGFLKLRQGGILKRKGSP